MFGKIIKKGLAVGSAAARLVAKEVRERRNPPVISRDAPTATGNESVKSYEARVLQPKDLSMLLDGSSPPLLLDCREEVEWVAGYIDGATHMPMAELPTHVEGLSRDRDVVVVCLNGVESVEVAEFLVVHNGFSQVRILDGGMVGWYADMGQDRIQVLRAVERMP